MPHSYLLVEVDDSGIALVSINRPDKLNALSGAVVAELEDAFAGIARDNSIRAAIITGVGEKAFVAGADIQELAQLTAFEARQFAVRGQRTFRMLETTCLHPVVPSDRH